MVDRRALVALNIALACLGSADAAVRAFLDIDISGDEERARLSADLSDVILHADRSRCSMCWQKGPSGGEMEP